MSEGFDVAGELNRLVEQGLVTEEALVAMTGIPGESIRAFLRSPASARAGMTAGPQPLAPSEGAPLGLLAAQLTEGLRIGDDERLRGILESLTIECRLSVENLARLAGVTVAEVEAALRDPAALQFEARYALMSRGSYLVNAVNTARGR
ncbi:HTH domain-containing protein [Herbiconiux solani]|uniref:HTH domain-containing protein n=1 Tax=Herbiconiux solani TaxID=661329 RepID=UPI0008251ABA|nr:HTH domain-containing protein [Herbiconiux solani]